MKTWKMMIGKDSVYSVVAETEHIVKKYGMGCGAKATPERLADFARYDAARRSARSDDTACAARRWRSRTRDMVRRRPHDNQARPHGAGQGV